MDTPITISKRAKPARQTNHLTIGCLIFPRMDQIDFTGPFEVLSRIPNSTIHVIAKTKSPVRDIQGLILTPEMTIAEAPEFDVLLVPGGYGQQHGRHRTHAPTVPRDMVSTPNWRRAASSPARAQALYREAPEARLSSSLSRPSLEFASVSEAGA
jgi:hypothetical protein